MQPGVLTGLRRLFARQVKGKRKLVLTRCYANNDAEKLLSVLPMCFGCYRKCYRK
jgi:hypothetical protein